MTPEQRAHYALECLHDAGIHLELRDGALVILPPIEDTPALRAYIAPVEPQIRAMLESADLDRVKRGMR